MNRTGMKKFQGMVKGFFDRTSQKIRSSMYRRNVKVNRDQEFAQQHYMNDERIQLRDDPDEYRNGSIYR